MTPRMRSFRRVLFAVAAIGGSLALAYALWTPGLVVKDGRNDKGTNGIWLAHGWLGGDEWFIQNAKNSELSKYRSQESIGALFQKLTRLIRFAVGDAAQCRIIFFHPITKRDHFGDHRQIKLQTLFHR